MNLTALIACKDRSHNLDYCLASIHVCSPRPHCIVVDYKSEIPLSYPQYPWLKVIRVENDGGIFHKSRALNIALRHTKTKFICATDADQIFNPNFFGVVYSQFVKQRNIIVMCKTYLLKYLYNITTKDMLNKVGYNRFLTAARQERQKLIGEGCCMGLPTSWAFSAHGWDESYIGWGYEDTDLLLRAGIAGFNRAYIDHLTNMIHLPHSRAGTYYSNTYAVRNKTRLSRKRAVKLVANKKKLVVANPNTWGQL